MKRFFYVMIVRFIWEIENNVCVRNFWAKRLAMCYWIVVNMLSIFETYVHNYGSHFQINQRHSWRTAAIDLGLDILSSCTFSDYTSDVQRFDSQIKSGIVEQFI